MKLHVKRTTNTRTFGQTLATLCLMAPLAPSPASAGAVTAVLSQDAWTTSGGLTANKGAAKTPHVSGPSGTVKNSYVKFDLSTLPAGTTGNLKREMGRTAS